MSSPTHYVFIDFENVQPKSLEVFDKPHFKIFLFVGASQTKLPFEMVSSIQQMGDKAEYVKISGNGPNALDFHIAFYIGQLVAADPNAHFQIISKDTGFDPLIQHLKLKKIHVTRSKNVPPNAPVKKVEATTPLDKLEVVISKLRKLEASKPRTVKTLSSTIAAVFQRTITDEEVASLVEALRLGDLISIADNKVTYSLPS